MDTTMQTLIKALVICLLLCGVSEARVVNVVTGYGLSSGPVYTDCSNIGTAIFYWNADHTSGTNRACINSTTTRTCTWYTATAVVSTSDPGTASPSSAGYVGKSTTGSSSLECSVTSEDIFDKDEGRLSVDVYLGASTGNNSIIRVTATNDEFHVYIGSDNTVGVVYRGNDGTVTTSVFSTDTVPDATWTNVQVRWSLANDKISVKIGSGSWKDDSDSDAVTAWHASPSYMRPFNYQTANSFYMDNFTVWATSGL